MARLLTEGFELQGGYDGLHDSVVSIQGNGITTTNPRTQNAALLCNTANTGSAIGVPGAVLDRTYYFRMYARFSTVTPTATQCIIAPWDGTNFETFRVNLNTDGTLALMDQTNTMVGSASSVLSANTYYRIEFEFMVPTAGNGILGLWVDGVQVARNASANTGTVLKGEIDIGRLLAAGNDAGLAITVDDIALNDNQGTDQNNKPGPGKVWLLSPASDNAVGAGWEAPLLTGSDTSSIFLSVKNIPPVGVAHSDVDANNTKYIFNAASNASTNYDANTVLPSSLISNSEKITLMQSIVSTGSSSATDTAGAVRLVSNPADSGETAFAAFDNGIAGTFPTNWKLWKGGIVYNPTVARGSAVVVRVGKRTAATRVTMVDYLGVIAESAPASLVYAPRVNRNTLVRR